MSRREHHRSRWQLYLLALLATGLIALLTWQLFFYRGVFRPIGEWQFSRLDYYFPLLTMGLLALLAMLPALLLLGAVWLWRRRRRRPAAVQSADNEVAMRLQRAQRGAARMTRFMGFATMAALIGLAISIILLFRLPTEDQPTAVVQTAAATVPANGPARLLGVPDRRRIAFLSRQVLLLRRDLYVAPIMPPRGKPVRYFVEVAGPGDDGSDVNGSFGILMRDGMPPPLLTLYRDAGLNMTSKPHLLFASSESLSWPYATAAYQLAIATLGFALFWGLFRWRWRRLNAAVAMVQIEKLRLSAS